MTSLMMAARNNHFELVKFLVENGADVNAKAENGTTALDLLSHILRKTRLHRALILLQTR